VGRGVGEKQQARTLGSGTAAVRKGNSIFGVRIWVGCQQEVHQVRSFSYTLQKGWGKSADGHLPVWYVICIAYKRGVAPLRCSNCDPAPSALRPWLSGVTRASQG